MATRGPLLSVIQETPTVIAGTYNSSTPAPADGQQCSIQLDAAANVKVVLAANTVSQSIAGTLTSNHAAPVANNLGVLSAVANSSTPLYTEGDQVLLSTDLNGNLRVLGTFTGTVVGTQNIDQWNGVNLGNPTTWGTAPTSQTVNGVNAYIAGQSVFSTGEGNVSSTTIRTVAAAELLDAFGRSRISSPQTLFNISFQYDLQSLLMQAVLAGTGSAAKTSNQSSATLSTGGTASGSGADFQSHGYYRYEPGKSLAISMTGIIGPAVANVRSQIGLFDSKDGVFFDQSNGMNVTVRTSTSGSASDTAVPQASWNIDPMNGTGPSGITLDFTKTQIFFIDLQWLGVGRVRFGFVVNGVLYYCHQVLNANSLIVPFMNTADLPVHWAIHNTGIAAGTNTILAICGAVISEGGNDSPAALSFTANNGATSISANARRPVLSIQPKTTFNSITNRSKINLKDVSIMCSGNPALYELVYNGTLTGASFSSVDANSGVNSDVSASAISGGTVVDSAYIPSGTSATRNAILKDIIQKIAFTLDAAGTTADIFSVVISGITGAAATTAALTWAEER